MMKSNTSFVCLVTSLARINFKKCFSNVANFSGLNNFSNVRVNMFRQREKTLSLRRPTLRRRVMMSLRMIQIRMSDRRPLLRR